MSMITNEALSAKIEATNGILNRVEKKVDDLSILVITPQVFELRLKELQIGINNNSLEIIEIKKEMAQDKKEAAETVRDDEEDKKAKVHLWMAGLFTLIGSLISGLAVYFLK